VHDLEGGGLVPLAPSQFSDVRQWYNWLREGARGGQGLDVEMVFKPGADCSFPSLWMACSA
jgi:hypothetical protein